MRGTDDFDDGIVQSATADWPAWAEDAVGAIGHDAVKKLLTQYAGMKIYIPKGIQESHPISMLIDYAAARVLCMMYGGETLPVPAVKTMEAAGEPRNETAEDSDFSRYEKYWTAWAKEATALIGPYLVTKILQRYGGTRLYIPKLIGKFHPLSDLIGHDAAKKMADEYGGGEHFDVPKGMRADLALRNEEIFVERGKGRSTREIALKYRLTERQVRNIYKKKR